MSAEKDRQGEYDSTAATERRRISYAKWMSKDITYLKSSL